MRISLTWLGHSTVVLDLDGVRLITDPLLSAHNGPLRRRTDLPHPERWRGAETVLISHLHHDHAELASLRRLPGVPVLTGSGNVAWLRRHGIAGAVGLDDGPADQPWHRVRDGVEVRLTRADHHHRPMPHRPNDAHGHLVRTPAVTVWAAGDTSLYDEMAAIPDLLGRPLDLAIVPISGWGPRLSGGHMDGAQAAEAVALTGARHALAVHWGTLHVPFMSERPQGWMDRPHQEFTKALARVAPDCALLDLRPGESASLPS
ncbi:MBL fold metallo-hydrolase [Nocardioides insulae]|uniref:MBL fold metallo-hydrolase n=1 Tax=Nocardioides insulae TaxID=394734 RepID=UPI000427812E|nr:MBL fold metallo-hydrolase [Nocardioides insulae]